MTCAHVLDLIDAGPLVNYPRAHFDRAWQHARTCDTCGPALQAATSLAAGLATLPQPASPPDLSASVMARIARIEVAREELAAAAPVSRHPMRARNWSVPIATLGGLAAGFAVVAPGNWTPAGMASAKVGGFMTTLVPMPSMSTWAVILVSGLVLYAMALFAPAGENRPHQSPL